jgi:putative endopeptidase
MGKILAERCSLAPWRANCARVRWILLPVLLLSSIPSSFAQDVPKPAGEKPVLSQAPVRFSASNLDRKTDPCVDFYQYACGGWITANPLPADEVRWDPGVILQRWDESVLLEVLEKAARNDPQRSKLEQEIGDYYAACMDDERIESEGIRPIQAELDRIAAIKNEHDFASEMGRLHRILFRLANPIISTSVYAPGSGQPLFELSGLADFDNASLTLAVVDQGGLGLPDREYYLRDDEESVQIRKEYLEHIRRTLELSGTNSDTAAAGVLAIETALARASADPASRRDFRTLNHKVSLRQLQNLMPDFSWSDYLLAVSAPVSPEYIVTVPDFFHRANELLRTIPLADWKLYLRWHLLRNASPMLNRALANEHFGFYGTILQGQKQQGSRGQRCLEATDRDLGDALGEVFIERTFSPGDKQRAVEIAAAVKMAMGEEIANLKWMTAATKQLALSKLRAIEIQVGYPDKWRDYSALQVNREGWARNAFLAGDFEQQRRVSRIGKAADREDWYITTPTMDAYYSAQQNRVVIPAGAIGPPFFDRNMDTAVNFGGLGSIAGHELTHGFDANGRNFDAKGNLRNWWAPSDSEMFQESAKCVSRQYSSYVVLGDVKVNGQLTLSENIADAAGLRLAYMALESTRSQESGPGEKIDGLSSEQRFFLSYALGWCGSFTPETLRKMLSSNPHSPSKHRVNGVVSNMPEFQHAFDCRKDQPMVRDNACRVW